MSCVLAIGQFDGIHLGHQAVLRAAADLARELDAVPLALSFSPHVDAVLHPEAPPLLLATPEQNLALVRACGIADLCLFPFSPEWAARPAADVLRALPAFRGAPVNALVVGENFTCGARGTTAAADLPALARPLGIPRVLAVPSVLHAGAPVSSTRIRAAVAAGDMPEAAAMLGRPFALTGPVVHGRAEGRKNGLPTANILPPLPLRPRPGVYAARLALPSLDLPPLPAAAFVPDPADPAQTARFGAVVEVHALSSAPLPSLYSRPAEVRFLSFVRPYAAFPSLAAEKDQILRDIEAMRPFWNLP